MGAQAPCILIADDDDRSRAELVRVLEGKGFAVKTSPAGREARARLSADRFDIVVADAGPPGCGGLELLRAAQRLDAPPAVILTAAAGGVGEAVAAMQAGAWDYLLKPFAPEMLDVAVRRALDARLPAPGADGRPAPQRSANKTFVSRDPRLLEVLQMARQVARSTATVLIQGESGTGKELLASYVHRHSLHPDAPYVAVNCAALPETLAESELFGHEKGAFTGAVARKAGKFELAGKGTLVLDEIGEMPLPLQAKLLRALQEKEVDRVGGGAPVPVDARVVAITNRDLGRAVAAGRFREDLFFRINVVPLAIPPLRERIGDIMLLADHFLARFNEQNGRRVAGFSDEALQALTRHDWRGNVRELENRLERAVLLAEGERIGPRDLGLSLPAEAAAGACRPMVFRPGITVSEMERQLIMGTLAQVDQNRTRAAEMLGISIRTLRNKLREYRAEASPPAEARSA